MELTISVALLSLIIMIADVALAFQGNWPEILGITLAAATYVGLLGGILKYLGRFPAPPSQLPLWVFLVSGGAAGLASGIVRLDLHSPLVMASAVLTPMLLATFHWVVLQRWAWVRAWTASRARTRAGRPSPPADSVSRNKTDPPSRRGRDRDV